MDRTNLEFNRGFLPYLGQPMHTLADLSDDPVLHDTETRPARLILRHINNKTTHHAAKIPSFNC